MASNSREEVMRESRFSEAQMVKILREADKAPVAEVSNKHGVSEQTIYIWRERFGAINAYEVTRLRQLEAEDLHRMVTGSCKTKLCRKLLHTPWSLVARRTTSAPQTFE
ncbi:MAG: transposase [Methyloversatilis sp.]|nr:transposase [Methyloversatilis sp.]